MSRSRSVPTTADPSAPVAHSAAGSDAASGLAAVDQRAVADYIFEMSGQLAAMADHAGIDLLAYLLGMVRLEAELIMNRSLPRDPGPAREAPQRHALKRPAT